MICVDLPGVGEAGMLTEQISTKLAERFTLLSEISNKQRWAIVFDVVFVNI